MCSNSLQEEIPIAQLIIIQDVTLRKHLEVINGKFSASRWKCFVTVPMGLLNYNGSKTLSGTLQQLAVEMTMSSPTRSVAFAIKCGTNSSKCRMNW